MTTAFVAKFIDSLTDERLDQWLLESWQLYASTTVGPPGQKKRYRLSVAVGREKAKIECKDFSTSDPETTLYEGDIYTAMKRFRKIVTEENE